MLYRGQTLLLALTMCACGADDQEVIELGTLEYLDQPAMIEVPRNSSVGESIRVLVTTYGGGCISFERTEIETTISGADFRPFDRRVIPGEDGKCPAILRLIPHEEYVSFSSPGTQKITVRGRRIDGHENPEISIDVDVEVN